MNRQQKAKEAMIRRSKEKVTKTGQDMNQYYAVIGFFIFSMVAALLFTVMNPQQNFSQTQVIDESAMLVHNGQNHRFQQGSNEFFQDWTISDAKKLFEQGLSDTPNLDKCKSGTMDVSIPESFDWREENPMCVQENTKITKACPHSYITSTLSAASDRICKHGGKFEKVRLSASELIDCDSNSECARGTVNKVLTWGKRRGFVAEACYPNAGKQGTCPEEHLTENECRQANLSYKIIDFCIAEEADGIKKEIMANGPVLGQLNPYTDMLTYSDGIYSRTGEAFKYNGNHIFKIVGWEDSPDGGSAWIVENTWGADWGENGYARISAGGETTLDFYAVSFAMYPKTMADYYAEQAAQANQQEEFNYDDLIADSDIFLDDEFENEMVFEEGIDTEL